MNDVSRSRRQNWRRLFVHEQRAIRRCRIAFLKNQCLRMMAPTFRDYGGINENAAAATRGLRRVSSSNLNSGERNRPGRRGLHARRILATLLAGNTPTPPAFRGGHFRSE